MKSYFILFTIYVFDKVYVHFYRSEHKEELGWRNPANVDIRHRELFVSWFEHKVSHFFLYNLIIHNLCIDNNSVYLSTCFSNNYECRSTIYMQREKLVI